MARQLPPNPISDSLDRGSEAFATAWRLWRRQWTQPQLLRLADGFFGARHLHSSQLSGFETRQLQNPAPKAFVVVGFLNQAHARSLGVPESELEPTSSIGLPRRLPESLRDLWEARQPLCDASGVVLGPTGLFAAFTGLRELPDAPSRSIAPEQGAAACAALGKWLRLRFASQGRDWLSELPDLEQRCHLASSLFVGRPCAVEPLVSAVPAIAALASATEDEVWKVIAGD